MSESVPNDREEEFTDWLRGEYFIIKRSKFIGGIIGGVLLFGGLLIPVYRSLAAKAAQAAEERIVRELEVGSFEEVKAAVEFITLEEAKLRQNGGIARIIALEGEAADLQRQLGNWSRGYGPFYDMWQAISLQHAGGHDSQVLEILRRHLKDPPGNNLDPKQPELP